MKKVLSLVLVIAMVLSSMSFAFAGTFEDVTGDYEDAVNALAGLGIVTGYEDGTYRPEKVVTRAEMAKLMVEILGYGDLVAGAKSNFTDTQSHWADAWIAIAAGRGVVIGDGNGKFRPDATVTYNEVLTMIVRGLGYTDDSNEIKTMTWPTNFKIKAAELGIIDGVKMNATGADRGGVAQALYNALECALVAVDNDGNVAYMKDLAGGQKLLLSRIADPKTIVVKPELLNESSKLYAGEIVDLAPYMYQSLNVYVNKNDNDEVIYIKSSNSLVVEGKVDKVDTTAKTINVKAADGTITKVPYELTTTTDIDVLTYYNGVEQEMITIADATYKAFEDIKIVGIEPANNSNGKIDAAEIEGFVVAEQTKVAKVENEYVAGKTKVDIFSLPLNSSDKVDLSKVKVEGAVDSIEDIQEDDVVVEYAAVSGSTVLKTKLVVSRDTVEGKVTRVDGSDRYIDGVKYGTNAISYTRPVANTTLGLGTEGIFFLDHNGKIAATDSLASTSAYAVVIASQTGDISTSFSTNSIKTNPQIKVATAEGEVVIYDLYVTLNSNGDEVLKSVKVNDTPVYAAGADPAVVEGVMPALITDLHNDLVKISLNSDGEVSKITTVTNASDLAYDSDLAKFNLASNVVVFDANDTTKYEVVSADRLKAEGTALWIAYNTNGQIAAIVTTHVKAGSESVYAYIDKANEAYNSKDEEVRLVVAYLKGQKVEYLTDDTAIAAGDVDNVYKVELDGTVITSTSLYSTTANNVTRTAITAYTVESVSTSTNSFVVNGQRYFLADNATILELDANGEGVSVADLYEIRGEHVTVYVDTVKSEVVFVTYVAQ